MPSWMRIAAAVLAVVGLIALQQLLSHQSVVHFAKGTDAPAFTARCPSVWSAGSQPFDAQDGGDTYVAKEYPVGDEDARHDVTNAEETGLGFACAAREDSMQNWSLLVGMVTTLLAAGALVGRRGPAPRPATWAASGSSAT